MWKLRMCKSWTGQKKLIGKIINRLLKLRKVKSMKNRFFFSQLKLFPVPKKEICDYVFFSGMILSVIESDKVWCYYQLQVLFDGDKELLGDF